MCVYCISFFFFQAEDGIRDLTVTGVQTCASDLLSAAARGATRTCRRPNAPAPGGSGTSLCCSWSRPPVARITQARMAWAPLGYGMNAGDTICSAPLVGIATGDRKSVV